MTNISYVVIAVSALLLIVLMIQNFRRRRAEEKIAEDDYVDDNFVSDGYTYMYETESFVTMRDHQNPGFVYGQEIMSLKSNDPEALLRADQPCEYKSDMPGGVFIADEDSTGSAPAFHQSLLLSQTKKRKKRSRDGDASVRVNKY